MSIEIPSSIQQYLQSGKVTEGEGRLTGSESETSAFIDYVRAHWTEILDNIDSIASSTRSQKVIVAAAENLPGRDYLQFMNKLSDCNAAGKITPRAFEGAVQSLTPKKRGFWGWNYQDQQVRKLVQRLQGLLPQNTALQSGLSEILSGAGVEAAHSATVGQGHHEPERLGPQ